LKQKSEEVRDTFHLDEEEKVIQNYKCGIKGVMGGGRMYLTQNYILYKGGIPSKTEKIPFRKINDIKYSTFLLQKFLTYEIEGGSEIVLTSFFGNHCMEAYTLSTYLWRNPPSYVSIIRLEEDQRVRQEEQRLQEEQSSRSKLFGDSGSISRGSGKSKYSGSFGQVFADQENKEEKVKVDVEASERALRLAQRSNGLAIQGLETLSRQGEQLDRIENKLDSIDLKLDLTKEYLRSIESLPGYIGNNIKKRKKKNSTKRK